MNTYTANQTAYCMEATTNWVAIYSSEELAQTHSQLGETAVVLMQYPVKGIELVGGFMEEPRDFALLTQIVGMLATIEQTKYTQEDTAQPAVTVDAAADALYSHLGHTGHLMTPVSAIRLAAAVRRADSEYEPNKLLGVLIDTIPAKQISIRYFAARADRRISDATHGRKMSAWPQVLPVA